MNHAYLPPAEPRCRPSQHCDRAQHCCRSLVPLPAAGGRVEDYTIWRTPLFNDCAAFVPVGQFVRTSRGFNMSDSLRSNEKKCEPRDAE